MKRKSAFSNFFNEKFYDFLDEQADQEVKTMSFPYGSLPKDQVEKWQLAVGLAFWRILRNEQAKGSGVKVTREMLAKFLKNDELALNNKYVSRVAKIESLPSSVWRKLLWRENIDLASYEACLRRLKPEQVKAIIDNYNDLFEENVIPRVFRKSLRDRVKIFFKKITVKGLLEEKYNPQKRNLSKGAYAYNLLSLDFGFSLYPKGNDNDTEIANRKFTRFLSVKEHVNDFVVNQEDGKYWWLYKKVRSNYAFRPKKEVQIKSHICPGFWKTLIIQTLFWIVSPIALIAAGITIMESGFTGKVLIGLLALPMILWSLMALLRFIWSLFVSIVRWTWNYILDPLRLWIWNSLSDPLKELTIKTKKVIKKTAKFTYRFVIKPLAVIIIGAWLCCLVFYAGQLIYWLAPIIGPLLATLVTLTAAFYFFFLLFCTNKKKPLFRYSNVPKAIKLLMYSSLVATVVVLFDKYLTKIIVNFFVKLGTAIWTWYMENLLLANWVILFTVLLIIFLYFYNLFFKDEKKFVKYEKLFKRVVNGLIFLATVSFAYIIYEIGIIFIPVLVIGLVFFALVYLFSLSLMMVIEVNEKNIEERERIRWSMIEFRTNNSLSRSYTTMVLRSNWLKELSDGEKELALGTIGRLSYLLFRDSEYKRISFIDLVIRKGSQTVLAALNDESYHTWRVYGKHELWLIISNMIKGKTLAEAEELIEKERNQQRKFGDSLEKIFQAFAWPITYPAKKIARFAKKVRELLLTLKALWVLFNKICPFVTESKPLE
jgi:hypothetical protein